jgi:two-component system, NtrC family, response regulator AtoC
MQPIKKSAAATPVPFDLQSLVDSHEQPFVVIDRDYQIMAVNSAYEQAFGVSREQAVGRPCYKVSHNNDAPCHESGEDCPHVNLFEIGQRDSCLHVHHDADHRICQVRVTAYPLYGSDGELYMGELIQEISAPEERRQNGRRMVGKTVPFLACMDQLKMVASAQAPVLLQGETGTGKELAASFIHNSSMRRDQPFLTVDCTVLTESLFEAEVFGHARGAFTGSVGERVGMYEQANGGTLFLDEVGELPMSQQAKLLRVLESGQYRRVGGRGYRKADVRIICATNRHLWDHVKTGQFREDLYYRIACLAVRLPPLRERLDDVGLLAQNLLELISRTMSRNFELTAEAIEQLKGYPYPGNVRELRNMLFIAATHCGGSGKIDSQTVSEVMRIHQQSRMQPCINRPAEAVVAPAVSAVPAAPATDNDKAISLTDVEAQHISQLLQEHNNNRRLVAKALNISERTLYRKLKKYGLS